MTLHSSLLLQPLKFIIMEFKPKHTETWGEIDSRTTVNLYMEDKEKYPNLEDFVAAGKYTDEGTVEDTETSIFSDFYKRYRVDSDFDCTGQCTSIDRTITIVEDEHIWCILQKTRCTYDY